jgi:hypothetical protein
MAAKTALDISKVLAKGAVSGVLAGGISWKVLDRNDKVDLYGFEMNRAFADVILVALSSVVGDALGVYAIPFAEDKIVKSASAREWLKMIAPPAIAGLTYYGTNRMAISPAEEESLVTDVLLAIGTKLAGDKVVDAFWQ